MALMASVYHSIRFKIGKEHGRKEGNEEVSC
jgi:hypothetical protein